MRRLRALATVAALALGLVAVGGCSKPDTAPPEVTVTGEPGAAPTVTYITPLDVDSTVKDQIWPGTGPELVDGQAVLIDFWLDIRHLWRPISIKYFGEEAS